MTIAPDWDLEAKPLTPAKRIDAGQVPPWTVNLECKTLLNCAVHACDAARSVYPDSRASRPACAYLERAYLIDADLSGANLSGAAAMPNGAQHCLVPRLGEGRPYRCLMRSTSAGRTAVPVAAPERQTNLPNVRPEILRLVLHALLIPQAIQSNN
jgi:hypothetical protein